MQRNGTGVAVPQTDIIAQVVFDNGEAFLGIYDPAIDAMTSRSLLQDTAAVRERLGRDNGSREVRQRFHGLVREVYGEDGEARDTRLVKLASVRQTVEKVRVFVGADDEGFVSEASRSHRFITGTLACAEPAL